MAVIYVRIPHYIASYLRNREAETGKAAEPLPMGKPYVIESGDPLAMIMQVHLLPNLRNVVNIACFSERQWKAMLQGKVICYGKDGFGLDRHRNARTPLTLAEIYSLTGHASLIRYEEDGSESDDEAYSHVYMPFQLPRTIVLNGREVRVQSDYTLEDTTEFVSELRDRFRMALTRYVAVDREQVHALQHYGLRRSKMESLDRFLLKYDIRYNDKVREQMKKLMNRSLAAANYSFDADEDHGRWSREHLDDTRLRRDHLPFSDRSRPLLCETTGVVYPSMTAFAREFGLQKANVCHALKKGWRIRGMVIRYAGDGEDTD